MIFGELKRFALMADLSDTEREELASLLQVRVLAPDETLFDEGQEADTLVLIVRGALQLTSSRTHENGVLGPGNTLGALALFRVGTREASAVAAEETQVALLTRSDFRRLADDHPRTACRLAEAVLARVAADCWAVLPRLDGGGG